MLQPRLAPASVASRAGSLQVCRTHDNTGSSLSRPTLYCASDASGVGFGAYVWGDKRPAFTFQQLFTTQEKKRQAEGRYDSNLREARAIRLGLEALLSKAPLAGAFIAWASDSFGMVGLLQALSRGKLRRIKSSELEAELKSILCLALEHDLTIAWVWAARDEPIIQVADFLSRRSSEMPAEARCHLSRLAAMSRVPACEPVALFAKELAEYRF